MEQEGRKSRRDSHSLSYCCVLDVVLGDLHTWNCYSKAWQHTFPPLLTNVGTRFGEGKKSVQVHTVSARSGIETLTFRVWQHWMCMLIVQIIVLEKQRSHMESLGSRNNCPDLYPWSPPTGCIPLSRLLNSLELSVPSPKKWWLIPSSQCCF